MGRHKHKNKVALVTPDGKFFCFANALRKKVLINDYYEQTGIQLREYKPKRLNRTKIV